MAWPPGQPLPPFSFKACPYCDHTGPHALNDEGTEYGCEYCNMWFAPEEGRD